ncbi:uncharacterized protein CCR75_002132 [Bremia lactucae]|uniref:Peptidase C1A papain C-terminal domain-containing protein n=1 Tax=Bremia lactucae TaxID=4779 RepID=A0A976I9Z8_BRELC|nr:hypothetical protein CCR75_002132 [Bremia lactucae]
MFAQMRGRAIVLVLLAVLAHAAAVSMTNQRVGTLVWCPSVRTEDSSCQWAGESGRVIDSRALRELFLKRSNVPFSIREAYNRNLQEHMTYLEDVNMYARQVRHEFSYDMGVNERHLSVPSTRKLSAFQFVDQEIYSAYSRRLQEVSGTTNSTSSSSNSSVYWNWCDKENAMGHSVCSPVKSQKSCGSCWSFVAADAIETAVVIAENASTAVSLSPQQFLTCSSLRTTQTFQYCWATENGVDGATWMQSEIIWESQNDGCNGGMTHGAFMDAAQNGWGLVTELTMPYDDANPASFSNSTSVCQTIPSEAAASITGYEQVVGLDCTVSNSCTVLLRSALQKQPIAVAITSNGGFGEYAGGFYNCPNNGDMASKNDLNHALLLVGYGTDSTVGDYWILKNSYGSSWGESGFIKLVADSKINCGLNVFPVVPTGAKAGAQASTSVDSGGDKKFVGLSPTAWITVAAATTIFTVVSTAIGIMVSHQKVKMIRKQNAAQISVNGQQRH